MNTRTDTRPSARVTADTSAPVTVSGVPRSADESTAPAAIGGVIVPSPASPATPRRVRARMSGTKASSATANGSRPEVASTYSSTWRPGICASAVSICGPAGTGR